MKLFRAPPHDLPIHHPALWLATWFGSGLAAKAPGTWGSLAALPFGWVIATESGPLGLTVASVIAFAIGTWAAQVYVDRSGEDDPGPVVIDEVVGVWMTLMVVPLSLGGFALAFVLFRLFDIWKPWPVSWSDRTLKGGLGVMVDDVLAAGYAMLAAHALQLGGLPLG